MLRHRVSIVPRWCPSSQRNPNAAFRAVETIPTRLRLPDPVYRRLFGDHKRRVLHMPTSDAMGSGPDSSVPAILKSAPVAAAESPGVRTAHTPKN